MRLTPARAQSFSSRLLAWYARHKRDLPWRHDVHNPYRVWISETLLQQTQVTTVIPYYKRFLARFPSVRALAKARLETVLKTWEGAGYYARAKPASRGKEIVALRREDTKRAKPSDVARSRSLYCRATLPLRTAMRRSSMGM
jgi:A/G-specific adenine glycosylase